MEDTTEISTVKDLPKRQGLGFLTERSVRHLLFHAETNGLADAGAIIRIGRRVLIDAQRFREWVEQHRTQGAPTGQSGGRYE